jgi:hypothetical protein
MPMRRLRVPHFLGAIVMASAVTLAGACAMRPLEGTVVAPNGDSLQGCVVTLNVGTSGGLQRTNTTDSSGHFSFGSVATAGGCSLQFDAEGYERATLVCPEDGKPLTVTLRSVQPNGATAK